MRLLLDTHFALWLALDEDRVSKAERALVERQDVEIVCSAVSLWEVRLKWNRATFEGVRDAPASPEAVMAFGHEMNWAFLPLRPEHAVAVLDVPIGHKDPFDELLLAQAQVEGLRLLTRDKALIGHPLALH
ncbi:MAG TPA: type II toxin-antitoxin system VapC family toxin [Allosphingosinicella sp.]